MKKTILNKAITVASTVLFSIFVASCAVDVADTTANFSEKEKEAITTTSSGSRTLKSGAVYCSVSSISDASKDTQIAVRLSSYAELDAESVENAVNFYTLTDNSEDRNYYPVRTEILPKVLLHTTEPSSYLYGGTTEFLYNVDTSSVTTSKIALFVDASLLKDKSGNAVLNLDEDDKAGEETDNAIKYIPVYYKANGFSTTSLYSSTSENFRTQYLSRYISKTELSGSNIGKIRFTVDAPVKTYSTGAYDNSLASVLADIYKLQIKPVSSTNWTDVALTFSYQTAYDNYQAETDVIPHETMWRLVRKNITTGSTPDWYSKVYGHAGYFFYSGSKEYTEIVYTGTSSVYLESPVNIYVYGKSQNNTSFTPANYSEETATDTQNSLLIVTGSTSAPVKWNIKPNPSSLALSSATDFIVTNANNKKVESTVKTITGGDGRVISVEVAVKNTNANGPFYLWVGNGTTLAENPKYPKQKKFGVPADTTKGDVSGYVRLSIDAGVSFEEYNTIYDSNSTSIDDFEITYVDGFEYVEYLYYLQEGTNYIIQWVDSDHSTLLYSAGYSTADGKIFITDESNNIMAETDDEASFSWECTSTKIYKIRVCGFSSTSSGYVAFHIYKE